MEFLKIKDYWTYQLPEWDNYEKEILEEKLSELDSVKIASYTMDTESDIWIVTYKESEFRLVNDLVHGCEIKTSNEEDLPLMEELIKSFDL